MKKVAIVTDTTACIPDEQVAKYEIELVPVTLVFEGKAYRDGIDISPGEFYKLLRKEKKPPTTAASSPTPYLAAYRQASERAESILCLTEPSKFSALYSSACLAMDMARTLLPAEIEVLNGTTAAAGLGLVTLAAARAAAEDKSLSEVMEVANSIMSRVNLFATLDTLHYLVKSGRVPQAAALVNSLLKIKPVFTLNHSDAHTVALPRTIPSAIKQMLKLMEQHTTERKPLHVAVMHADAMDKAVALKNRISSQFNCTELFITEFTPVMGVHTGPGLLGIAFYPEE